MAFPLPSLAKIFYYESKGGTVATDIFLAISYISLRSMAVLPGALLSVPRVSVEAAKTRANERPRGGGGTRRKIG